MNYAVINIILNSILVGIILLTQFVNYPLQIVIAKIINQDKAKITPK